MNLDDFMDEVHINAYEDIEDEGFTTVGGMAMFFIGRIPKAGDLFTYQNGERVDKLLVYVQPKENEKNKN